MITIEVTFAQLPQVMASVRALVSILILSGIAAPLPDIDSQLKTFWFRHINPTISTIKDAIDFDHRMRHNITEDHCHQHFQELIAAALRGELWANQSESHINA